MALLDGQTAIITGAAGGLGSAFARALSREGASLALCDVDPRVEALAAEIERAGGKAMGRRVDLAQPTEIQRFIEEVVETLGPIDLLINNAATWFRTPVTDPWDKAVQDLERLVNTNVRGTFVMTRLAVAHMGGERSGNIVNISNDDVMPPRRAGTNPADTDIFNAAAWTMNAFTQSWAQWMKERGVRVNALAVGPADTAMGHARFGDSQAMLQPDDVARLLIDLLAEGPHGRTGENIGAWPGHPLELGPRKLPHRAMVG
jgi:NAD(P)-dependent dehydrogenase (short-subunit alcohol dehydrogenase family)